MIVREPTIPHFLVFHSKQTLSFLHIDKWDVAAEVVCKLQQDCEGQLQTITSATASAILGEMLGNFDGTDT